VSRVTPELHAAILGRDGACVLWKLDPTHVCHDAWGQEHDATAVWMLSLEHVKDEPRMGVRAPSDPQHLVAMCYGSNLDVPSKAQRQAIREYLRAVAA
jgi:hypothetical protein